MGIISKDSRMTKIYYSSSSRVGKQSLAYLQASENDILAIDVTKTNVTGTMWKEMAENLNTNIENLIDKDALDHSEITGDDVNLSETDWIKVLDKHPEALTNPIVILGEKYYQIHNPSDIEKHLKPNSKAIDEKKYL